MSKRGAELTLNVIIIAVLALIVLAVLLFIFTGKVGSFNKGLKDCAALGGDCTGQVEITADEVSKIKCSDGAPVYGTNCETAAGCCLTLD